ncbi:MAG: hypothetical protein JSW08_03435 [archaeon]|nr:MAG: hypothetical protein JSW08_03435 [archaeon]
MRENTKKTPKTWKIILIVILVIILLLLLRSAPTDCEPPLMDHGDGCCMDANNNNLCDSVEKINTTNQTNLST